MEAHFLYNPKDKGDFCHASTLLETAKGDLLACWYVYKDKEHVNACLALARRRKGHAKWDKCESLMDSREYSVGNPVLFQEPGGHIWLLFVVLKGAYWGDAVLEGMSSTDDGYSWSTPVQLWKNKGMMIKHPPVLLNNGSLLLPAYDEAALRSVLLTSRPPYRKWEEAYCFSDIEIIQPVLVREASSRLGLFFRPCTDPRQIWRSHSQDEGVTWSVPIRTPLPNPLSGVGAFVVDGHIAVVYNHTEKHQRFPLSISLSHNGGTSWGKPWNIDNIQQEVSYPSFFLGQNDIIHGVYTYNRRFIKYVSIPKEELLQKYGQDN